MAALSSIPKDYWGAHPPLLTNPCEWLSAGACARYMDRSYLHALKVLRDSTVPSKMEGKRRVYEKAGFEQLLRDILFARVATLPIHPISAPSPPWPDKSKYIDRKEVCQILGVDSAEMQRRLAIRAFPGSRPIKGGGHGYDRERMLSFLHVYALVISTARRKELSAIYINSPESIG